MKFKNISASQYLTLVGKVNRLQSDVRVLKQQFSQLQLILLNQLKEDAALDEQYEAYGGQDESDIENFSDGIEKTSTTTKRKMASAHTGTENQNKKTKSSIVQSDTKYNDNDVLLGPDGIKIEYDSADGDGRGNEYNDDNNYAHQFESTAIKTRQYNSKNYYNNNINNNDDDDDENDEDYQVSDSTMDDDEWDPSIRFSKRQKKLSPKKPKLEKPEKPEKSEKILKNPKKKKYECGHCKLYFYLKSAPKTDPYKCKKCIQEMIVEKGRNLPMDPVMYSLGRKVVKCEVCNRYMQSSHMKRHAREHLDIRTFECDVCDKSFKRMYHLKRHQVLHTGERIYRCPECVESFDYQKQLNKHLKDKHDIVIELKPRVKKLAASSQDTSSTITLPINKTEAVDTDFDDDKTDDDTGHHHNNNIACIDIKNDVDSSTNNDTNNDVNNRSDAGGVNGDEEVKKKRRRKPEDKERCHMCDICGQTFYRSAHLTRHVLTHTIKTFRCEKCGKLFSRKTHMNKHLNNHKIKGVDGFNCYICGETFEDNPTMMTHIETAHKDLERQVKTCSFCDMEFKTGSQLNAHLKSTHLSQLYATTKTENGGGEDEDAKGNIEKVNDSNDAGVVDGNVEDHGNFSCDVCHKSYKNLRNLLLHTNSHSHDPDGPLKPHECDVCDAKFSTRHSMKRHRRTHYDNYIYKCNFCCVTYTRKYLLTKHISTNHSDEVGAVVTKVEDDTADSSNHSGSMSSSTNQIESLNLTTANETDSVGNESTVADKIAANENAALKFRANQSQTLIPVSNDLSNTVNNVIALNQPSTNCITSDQSSNHVVSLNQPTNQITANNQSNNYAVSLNNMTNQINPTNNFAYSFNQSPNYINSFNQPTNRMTPFNQSANLLNQSAHHIESLIQASNQNNALLPTANDMNMLNLSANQHQLPNHTMYTHLKF